jgi:hypothetical protein
MKLVFGEECEPIDAVLLVFSQFSLDFHGDVVCLDLTAVQELCQELPLFLSSLQEIFREARRVWQTSLKRIEQHSSVRTISPYLKRDHFHERSKSVRGCRANIIIWVAHASQDWNYEENNIG